MYASARYGQSTPQVPSRASKQPPLLRHLEPRDLCPDTSCPGSIFAPSLRKTQRNDYSDQNEFTEYETDSCARSCIDVPAPQQLPVASQLNYSGLDDEDCEWTQDPSLHPPSVRIRPIDLPPVSPILPRPQVDIVPPKLLPAGYQQLLRSLRTSMDRTGRGYQAVDKLNNVRARCYRTANIVVSLNSHSVPSCHAHIARPGAE
jgi:hypothetical protein